MENHLKAGLNSDQRWVQRIGKVEAVIVAEGAAGSCPAEDDGGLARHVVEAAIERTGAAPVAIRY